MFSLQVKVEGLDNLVRFLSRFEDLREPVGDAVQLFLEKTVFDAKAVVPVRTGMLQRSIVFGGGGLEWWVGSRLDYAPYIEFGTSRMSPRPYIWPALNQNVPNLHRYLVEMFENRFGG